MAKNKEEKTNVMRILDQKKIPYTARFYEESEGPEGTREYGVHIAQTLGQEPGPGIQDPGGPGRFRRHLCDLKCLPRRIWT